MKTTNDIIEIIIAGGLLGILGQGIRMAIGLKKLSDANAQKGIEEAEELNTSRLLTSLFIGFIAGALFLLIRIPVDLSNKEFIFTVIAAGYSGSDFIEGLFNTTIAKIGTTTTKANTSKTTPEETPKVDTQATAVATVNTATPTPENLVVENELQTNNANIQG